MRDRLNPLEEYEDANFGLRFRLRKNCYHIHRNFEKRSRTLNEDRLAHHTSAASASDRFHATASFHQVIGDLSNYTVCKVIHRVSRVIAKHKRQFISIPAELHETKRRFYDIAGFPCVVGAIDCAHVRIVCPNTNNAVAFINRKLFYSVNVQAVCDSKALITNIVARWPGATHGSRIFDNSTTAEQFRNGSISGLFVGDSGYAHRSYLLTTLLNPRSDAEARYNEAQRRT